MHLGLTLSVPALGLIVTTLAGCSTGDTAESSGIVTVPPRAEVTTTSVPLIATSLPGTVTATTEAELAGGVGLDALEVLARIPVVREVGAGYNRDLFEHWIDADGNGCNTREEVLIRDSVGFAQVDPFGCTVVAGDWRSSYDGAVWSDPSDVDIDHVVALKEAWDSGAHAWSAVKRRAFANDLSDVRSLRAVTDSVNQSKGDRDPSNWMPPSRSAWCGYLADWTAVKARWGLSMDESEHGRIRRLFAGDCAGTRIAPWPVAPGG